jgi:hypothetical protein
MLDNSISNIVIMHLQHATNCNNNLPMSSNSNDTLSPFKSKVEGLVHGVLSVWSPLGNAFSTSGFNDQLDGIFS